MGLGSWDKEIWVATPAPKQPVIQCSMYMLSITYLDYPNMLTSNSRERLRSRQIELEGGPVEEVHGERDSLIVVPARFQIRTTMYVLVS